LTWNFVFLSAVSVTERDATDVTSPNGRGYWIVAADGGVFTFGNARFRGSLGGSPVPRPITGVVPTESGRGYWLLDTGGTASPFGDAG
jgi:hypothetical protein